MRAGRFVAAAVLALAAPAAARAQGCVGAPLPRGGRAVQAQAGISTVHAGRELSSTDVGAAFRADPAGPLALSAEYLLRSVGGEGAKVHTVSAALALRLPFPARLPVVCARAGLGGAFHADGDTGSGYASFTVPLGLVLELPLAAGPGRTVAPYAAPQLLWSTTSGEFLGERGLAEADAGVGVEAGVGVRSGRFVAGAGASISTLDPRLGAPAVPARALHVRAGMLF